MNPNRSQNLPGVYLLKAIYALFMPPLCIGCGNELSLNEKWLCRRCLQELFLTSHTSVRFLKVGSCNIDVHYALDYTYLVSRLIATFKYHDRPGLAGLLARIVVMRLKGFLMGNLILVSVPMCGAKLRERGYNQSDLLCREIAELSGLRQVPNALKKLSSTSSQAGLPRSERMRNLMGKIRMNPNISFKDEHVVIVDDVVTTGSTLRECAKALLATGAKRVSACVVASSP